MSTVTADPEAPSIPPPKSGGGLGGIVKIGGLVLVLLIAQVGIFWVFFGGPAPAPAAAATQTSATEAAKKAEVAVPDEYSEVQVSLQPFRCTNGKAAAGGGTVHIDFKLVALVPAPQAIKFADKLKSHESRIRQIVSTVARSLTLEDLNDPELKVMKRRMREEINKSLKDVVVQEIIVVDYTHMEQ